MITKPLFYRRPRNHPPFGQRRRPVAGPTYKGIFPRCGGARCLGPTLAIWMSPLPHYSPERARVRVREQTERATVPNNYWSATTYADNPNNAWNVNFNNGNANNNNKTNDNRFRIAGGVAGMKVSWQVTGLRQDAYIKAHPLHVEEGKPDSERGKYLSPAAYGMPESMGVNYSTDAAQPPGGRP